MSGFFGDLHPHVLPRVEERKHSTPAVHMHSRTVHKSPAGVRNLVLSESYPVVKYSGLLTQGQSTNPGVKRMCCTPLRFIHHHHPTAVTRWVNLLCLTSPLDNGNKNGADLVGLLRREWVQTCMVTKPVPSTQYMWDSMKIKVYMWDSMKIKVSVFQ